MDCSLDRRCDEGKCVDPCLKDSPCADTAQCTADDHAAKCACPTGMTGNPRENCLAVGCRGNQDCPNNLACIGEVCENPCENNGRCSKQLCTVENHEAVCPCSFVPLEQRTSKDACHSSQVAACLSDKDCGPGTICKRGLCMNPCETDQSQCARGALCLVVEALPFKSVACTCPEGFSGDAKNQCLESMTTLVVSLYLCHVIESFFFPLSHIFMCLILCMWYYYNCNCRIYVCHNAIICL